MSNVPSAWTVPSTTLVELLRDRARHQPDRLAYCFLLDGRSSEANISYGKLDRQARAIASTLLRLDAAGKRALLLYPPGLDYIAAFFGCLYAGVVAVPAYPPRPHRPIPRLQAILTDAQPALALTTTALHDGIREQFSQHTSSEGLHWLVTDQPAATAEPAWSMPDLRAETLAFLQYTSGSTATPKGVMLTHGNLLHNLELIARAFEQTSESRGVIWLPPYHDMGLIGGILQPLYAGFPVTLMSPVTFLQSPARWLQAITRSQATASGGPNFAYDLCVQKITPEQKETLDLSHWNVAFCGAEPIRAETLNRFAAAFAPCGFRREAFYPCYGLAEATLMVSGGSRSAPPVIRAFDAAALDRNQVVAASETQPSKQLVGCGTALSGQQIAIVQPDDLRVCAPGEVGEVWVAGPSVAQGYWGRPAETERTFGASIAESGAGPFLRTGDLGFIHDDQVFVTGRLKDLIIIRGRNLYPQDIELTVEQSSPALRSAGGAAFVVEADDQERLVVVQEVERRQRDLDGAAVIAAIRQEVAEQHEVHIDTVVLIKTGSIPKTSSGKIQRHLCRAHFLANTLDVVASNAAQAQPATPDAQLDLDTLLAVPFHERPALLVAYLSQRIAHLLLIAPPPADQPLNTLGLDSLMVIELQHDVEERFGVVMPMTRMLHGPTIAELAAEISDSIAEREAGEPQSAVEAPQDHYPLSYGQRALWFLHQLAPSSAAYNIASAVNIYAQVDHAALRRAFQSLLDRHAVLRAAFSAPQGEPQIHIRPHVELWLQVQDATAWSVAEVQRLVADAAAAPFDLAHGPLLRVHLFERAEHECVLVLSVHHIVADFWSLAIVLHELGALYAAEQAQVPAMLPAATATYADYVRWQSNLLNGPEATRLADYWRQQLSGDLPVLDLPTDHPRPPVQSFRGGTHTFQIDAALTNRLRTLAQASGATLYMTLLAAFQVLLHRYTGQEDLLVGSPSAGRERAKFADLVGYFVNPVVLRADLSGNPPFATFLAATRQTVLDALAHQAYPFALLVEQLQPSRDPARSPLFQVMFALERSHLSEQRAVPLFIPDQAGRRLRLGSLEVEPFGFQQSNAQFDLALMVEETSDVLFASLQYSTDLFDGATIERMAAHWQMLLQGIVADPSQRLSALPLLTPAEHRQMLIDWNSSAADYPRAATVHQLFEAQAMRTPDTTAIVFDGARLTYAELNSRANQLAHHLRAKGIGGCPGPKGTSDMLVALCAERSPELIVAILAILKAGGAYVPLDPAYPAERLQYMLSQTRTPMLLTQSTLMARLQPEGVRHQSQVFCLDADWECVADQPVTNPPSTVTPDHLAYVIFTSGSTGQPKGVCCHHRGVVNLLADFQRRQPLAPGMACSWWTSLSFDVSVYELCSALVAGGTLHIVPDAARIDSLALGHWLSEHQIVSAYLPPFMLADLVSAWETAPAPPLHRLLVGVEPIPEPLLARITAAIPGLQIINGYGPTETTVCATLYSFDPHTVGDEMTPIGRPVQNMQVYVLDTQMQPVPVGVVGEVFIGGVGVARGYLHQPERTAERFVPDPFSATLGTRLYRTGDLARYRADGNLMFIGRRDQQIKLRGYRIELGEIEAILNQHRAVHEAVVLAWEELPGEKQLVGYVVFEDEASSRQQELEADLRAFLLERLPQYMLPSRFVFLKALPVTTNGKLDRKALPAPDFSQTKAQYIAPRTPIEETLAAIWAEMLKLEKPGIHDNFFELGGHSLLATRTLHRMREVFQVDLPVQVFFEQPTIASLAAAIERAKTEQIGPAKPKLQPRARGTKQLSHLLRDLQQLSPDEVKKMLQAKQGRDDTDSGSG
jgi:amino acid adenylation domain-containing protein